MGWMLHVDQVSERERAKGLEPVEVREISRGSCRHTGWVVAGWLLAALAALLVPLVPVLGMRASRVLVAAMAPGLYETQEGEMLKAQEAQEALVGGRLAEEIYPFHE